MHLKLPFHAAVLTDSKICLYIVKSALDAYLAKLKTIIYDRPTPLSKGLPWWCSG